MLDSTTEFILFINNLNPGNTALVNVIIGAILKGLDYNFRILYIYIYWPWQKFLDLKKIYMALYPRISG